MESSNIINNNKIDVYTMMPYQNSTKESVDKSLGVLIFSSKWGRKAVGLNYTI